MNKFVTHGTNETTTENGQLSFKSTLNACLDLFYQINASRGKDLSALFKKAYKEDQVTALAVLLYSRDIRGGQGERQMFRDIIRGNIKHVITEAHQKALIKATIEVGRFDDLKVFIDCGSETVKATAVQLWADQIKAGNFLAAKWCPSTSKKGAAPIRKACGFKLDKDWRKYLSEIAKSKTVENIVCNTKEYGRIDYSKLPSKAMNRWKRNFIEHDEDHFEDYLSALTAGEAKVNAATLYPYEIYKSIVGDSYWSEKVEINASKNIIDLAEAQWKALPEYGTNNENILPVLDRSGSMTSNYADPKAHVSAGMVANSLALYISERNTGDFNNVIMSFANNPEMTKVEGKTLKDRILNLNKVQVGYSTNFRAVFDKILNLGLRYNIPNDEMPSKLLVVSDMQFNGTGWGASETIMQSVEAKYEAAGYTVPQIVFWNVCARAGSTPVTYDKAGTALVSGFSPVILKQVLGEELDPITVMKKTVLVDRYLISNY